MGLDNQNQRQNIVGRVNAIISTLDFDIQLKKERQNADAWKKLFRDLGQTVGNITDNPIPFILGLIKLLKAKSTKDPKSERAQQRAFRRKEKKARRKEDKSSSTTWMEEKNPKVDAWLKNNVDEDYCRLLRDIIKRSVKKVVPKIPDMFEEKLISYLFLMQESDLIRAHKQTLLSFNKLNEADMLTGTDDISFVIDIVAVVVGIFFVFKVYNLLSVEVSFVH